MTALTPATLSGHAQHIVDLLRRSFIGTGDPLVAEAIRELLIMQGELPIDEAAQIVAAARLRFQKKRTPDPCA